MKLTKFLFLSVALLVMGAVGGNALAKDTIDAVDFVDEASAKGIAEVETSKLALQKSTSPDVKKFAEQMIADHTAANKELAAIAQKKELKVADEAALTAKAKSYILKHKEGENFDKAYAEGQVAAHKDTIKLFNQAVVSPDAELAAFAKATLPKLEHHLHMAQDLAKAHDKK